MFQLFVREHKTNKQFGVTLPINATLGALKSAISERYHVSIARVQIVFAGQVLSNDWFQLRETGIFRETFVNLNISDDPRTLYMRWWSWWCVVATMCQRLNKRTTYAMVCRIRRTSAAFTVAYSRAGGCHQPSAARRRAAARS